jgi:hypothetical protein
VFLNKLIQLINENEDLLFIKIDDSFEIERTYSLHLERTQIFNAIYDVNSYPGTFECRSDFLHDIHKIHCESNLTISLKNNKVKFSNEVTKEEGFFHFLTIDENESYKFLIHRDETVQLSFEDFYAGIQISNCISSKLTIELPEPGKPVILKSFMVNLLAFEMVLSTLNIETADSQPETESEIEPIRNLSTTFIRAPNGDIGIEIPKKRRILSG